MFHRVSVPRRSSPRPAGGGVAGSAVALLVGALLAPWLPSAAAGQEAGPGASASLDAESLQAVLVRGFEEHRAMDLSIVAAIPDSALRWAPTPGVRDFAQQVQHAAGANALLMAGAVLDRTPPALGDTATYLNDKEALAGFVEDAYDWVLEGLRSLPPEELLAETQLIGRTVTKWNAVLFALQHGDWTRGQLVPYFRLNGVEPPQWRFY